MRELTPELPARLALAENAECLPPGNRWRFHRGSGCVYGETQALRLVRIALTLGITPTDILTAEMFEAVLARIVAIERRLPAGGMP
jgi:hypothetical protein